MPGTVSYTNNEPIWAIFNATLLGLVDEGDVTLSIKGEWVDKTAHQTGNYLLDAFWKGERCTVQATLAESDNWDNWAEAFPIGEKQADGATPPNNRVVGSPSAANSPYIGQRATSYTSKLVLRPVAQYVDVSTEKSRDVVLPKAFVREMGDIVYSIDNAKVLPITFEALFDPDGTDGENLWIHGLETAGAGSWSAV